MINPDRMNLANEIDLIGEIKPGTPKSYYALISSIIAWLPALPIERLLTCLTHIQEDAKHYIDSDTFTEYMKEQREVEAGDLTAPSFLQGIIENSIKKSLSQINDLEGCNSGLDAVCDQMKTEIESLESTIDKLKLVSLTCLQILEIYTDKEGNHLTHTERNAYAKVGLGILNKLFPDGLEDTPLAKKLKPLPINDPLDDLFF